MVSFKFIHILTPIRLHMMQTFNDSRKEAYQKHCWKRVTAIFSPFQQCFLAYQNLNSINPFPNKLWFLRVCSTSLSKTLCEKEKLLVTSNFSFSNCVFYQFGKQPAIFIKSEIVPM